MKVVIRADASIAIGTGHVMRCLTLASRLAKAGAEVVFICRELSGNLCAFIEGKGFCVERLTGVESLPESAELYERWLGVGIERDADETIDILKREQGVDWLVIDHYSLAQSWEELMRPYVKRIMVIDDLTNRPHDCDLLLNQNFCNNAETLYSGLVPEDCKRLIGPRYALLREQFAQARTRIYKRQEDAKRIFVFMGGADPTDETSKVLEAIRLLNMPDIAVDAVVGGGNPHKDRVKELCAAMPNAHFHCEVENMAQLMAEADLAVGAGGTATWERFCMGLPSIIITIAKNQVVATEDLAEAGCLVYIGWHEKVDAALLCRCMTELLNDNERLIRYSKISKDMVDGRGVERVVERLRNL